MQDHQAALLAAAKVIAARTNPARQDGDQTIATEIVRLASAILIEMRKEKLASGAQSRG